MNNLQYELSISSEMIMLILGNLRPSNTQSEPVMEILSGMKINRVWRQSERDFCIKRKEGPAIGESRHV